jgi:hypothetical protein
VADERLHLRFAEVAAVGAPKAAAESLRAGDTDPNPIDIDDRRLTFEDPHARVLEDPPDLVLTPGVVVMVAEHGDHRNPHPAQLVGKDLDFLRSTASRQVTGEEEEVGAVVKMLEAGAEDFLRTVAVVEIANGGDADHDTGSSLSGSAAETTVVSFKTS